jgi:hypothetical protein
MPLFFIGPLIYCCLCGAVCQRPAQLASPRQLSHRSPGTLRGLSADRLLNAEIPKYRPLVVQIVQRQGPAEVQLSLSVRVNAAGQPRFVMAFKRADEGDNAALESNVPQQIIDHFERSADQIIQWVERTNTLDVRLKAKLRFAARGDMSRLLNEVREVQQKYAGNPLGNQAELVALGNQLSGLNEVLSEGVDRQGSLFNRVLISNLSAAQLQDLVSRQFGEQLDRWGLDLTAVQRTRLIELMRIQGQRQTEPKVRWTAAECASLLHSLNRAELESIVDAAQLKIIDLLSAGRPLP